MRIGIATLNGSQASIMSELLAPIASSVTVYDEVAMLQGKLLESNDHVVIIDYSVDSIMDYDFVMELLERSEPKTILSEKSLYSLKHDERLAWRKKLLDEIVRLLPDMASQLKSHKQNAKTHDIWVIGTSTGGPNALSELLPNLPALPISLVIAQHMSSNDGLEALKKVLNDRQSRWKVEVGGEGTRIVKGHVYLVPRDTVFSVEGDRLSARELILPNQPSPSVNANIRSLRKSSNGKMGMIILTGLGDDGAAALREVKHKTISVMAQEASQCASSSMPDAARSAGVVDYTGTVAGIIKQVCAIYGHGLN